MLLLEYLGPLSRQFIAEIKVKGYVFSWIGPFEAACDIRTMRETPSVPELFALLQM